MASSPNWRVHFKDILKFYKEYFEITSLCTVGSELQLKDLSNNYENI